MQFRQQSAIFMKPGWCLPALGLSAFLFWSNANAGSMPSDAARLSPADFSQWREQAFSAHTQYNIAEQGGHLVLRAKAHGSASALCRTVQFDLKSLPFVRWSWRLDRAPPRDDERGRNGDDQGLRLSFLYQSGTTEESMLAIQYVWLQNEPRNATWANAYLANAHELVARSGPAQPGVWQTERRDLRADFRTVLGRDVDRTDAVCIMTDGDQTAALVEGWYGDITLEAR